jgi:CRISPR-associated protein Cas1
MIEDIIDTRQLVAAWKRCRTNGGTAGVDRIDAEAFGHSLSYNLRILAAEVRTGQYRPAALRAVPIPKPDGGTRVLRIPCVRDRVLQGAASAVLLPDLDRKMSASSFGYRPRRSVAMALDAARKGIGWTLDADIRRFFDEVSHRPLRRALPDWIPCPETRRLIALWLRGFGRRGLAQGAPISPLLVNIALDDLDRALRRGGRLHVRYADDFLTVCPTRAGAEQARRCAARVLHPWGLSLHRDKTCIVPPLTEISFLGGTLMMKPADGQKGGVRSKPLKRNKKQCSTVAKRQENQFRHALFRLGWKIIRNLT